MKLSINFINLIIIFFFSILFSLLVGSKFYGYGIDYYAIYRYPNFLTGGWTNYLGWKISTFSIFGISLGTYLVSFLLSLSVGILFKEYLSLKKISNNFTRHSRICLNHSKTDTLHQMLICQPHKFFPEIKKHPKKNKIYQIIRGKQKIIIFNKSKKIIKEFKIDKKNFMLCLDKNQWHQNISLTKYSIHLETISGPFKRNEDRTYL